MMVVVILRSAHRGAEQQEANPGLDEGEGGAVRVTSSHHHLRRDRGEKNSHSSTEKLRGWFDPVKEQEQLTPNHPLDFLTSQKC